MWMKNCSVSVTRRQALLSRCRRSKSTIAGRGGGLLIHRDENSSSLNSSCVKGSRTSSSWSAVCKNNSSVLPTMMTLNECSSSSSGSSFSGSRFLSTAATRRRRKEEERLLVVGSGVAGCSAALIAAERYGIPVTLVYAGDAPTDCNSYWAQGGIIYRNYDPASNDSAESLVQDVHRAGAGLCKDSAVWKLALDGPDRVRELLLDPSGIFANVPFDRTADGELSCCLEASHAAPRIIHKADHTGKAITDHITAAALKHPLIQVLSNSIVTDLITTEQQQQQQQQVCLGAMVMNKQTGQTQSITALHGTLLASGGLAGIYQHSTNPSGFNALGSSVALATRAGAHTSDLEYVQFHPTALYIPNESRFLLTEALRGEGAKLRDASGRAFAKDFHPDGELAPRDVVARGVFNELQKSADQHNVFLDITHRDADWLRGRFPSIDQHLQARGLDITKDVLPITPAAHYTCGGITTDLNGCTNVLGLYSAGEAARTGLHGGNRLASTSLLEGLVYGAAVADYVGKKSVSLLEMSREQQHIHGTMNTEIQEDYKRRQQQQQSSNDAIVERAQDLLHHLKRVMWDHVGVVRTPEGLSKAATELSYIREEAYDLFDSQPCMQTSALRDAVIAGQAVTTAALSNRVSAGAHCIVLDEVLRTDEDEDYTDDEEEDVALASVTN